MEAQIKEYARRHSIDRNKYWCVNCEDWVSVSDMRTRRLDDDISTEKDCPDFDVIVAE